MNTKKYTAYEISTFIIEKNKIIDDLKIIVPHNNLSKRLDLFLKAVYPHPLNKYNIVNFGSLNGLPISLFNKKDFKKGTTLIGLLSYLEKYIGCSFCIGECDVPDFKLSTVPLSCDDFYFLNNKEQIVLQKRFIEKLTLSEIGNLPGVDISRERVRQIEQKIFHYLKIFSISNIFPVINNVVKENNIFCSSKISNLFLNQDGQNIFKYFSAFVTVKDFKYKYSFSHELFFNTSVLSFGSFIEGIKDFQHSKGKILLTLKDIASVLKQSPEVSLDVISCLLEKQILVSFQEKYFLYPKHKGFAVEVFIASLKDGYSLKLDFDNMINWLNKYVPEFMNDKGYKIKKENFNSYIENNERIILWGWGKYAHIQNIEKSFMIPMTNISPFIKKEVEQNLVLNSVFIYNKFKKLCEEYNIPDQNALYSVLRIRLQNEYLFKHCPWIRDLDLDSAKIVDIIAAMLKEAGGKVSIKSISNRFGISTARVTQLLSHSDLVKSPQRGYFIYKETEHE